MSARHFDPYTSNGRWLGRWLEAVGIALERAGIWLQRPAAWLRWRRVTLLTVDERDDESPERHTESTDR